MSQVEKLEVFIGGRFIESKTAKYMDIYNPSIGEVFAKTPCCTVDELEAAITAAKGAYPAWSGLPTAKRAQVFFKMRDLLLKNLDDLTECLSTENGKAWDEAAGDVMKVVEITEFVCGTPSLLMGESMMDTSTGYDSTLYREPMGVFAGIAPFNFPAMIPMGWMSTMAMACGNTYVLKAASMTPKTALKIAALYKEAGLPDGVLNVVTCSRKEAELLLSHPDIKGITFVGSTNIGLQVYEQAAKNGKKVQALCEAKNHALVLRDAPIVRTAAGIVNSAFGCAGERCMALPVIAVEESIADELVAEIIAQCKDKKIGPSYDKTTNLGPVVTKEHKEFVLSWIEKGIQEGAKLVLDGRDIVVPGYENGFYIGHTIFDHVTEEMTVGDEEIFGPVLCIKRVKDFEDGLRIMNNNKYANGSVIYTSSGYYSREFVKRTHGGMVGINVGIPVPMAFFPFTGHKLSFFGDLHCLGKDGLRFFTETKLVTTTWFDDAEKKARNVHTWDGSLLQ